MPARSKIALRQGLKLVPILAVSQELYNKYASLSIHKIIHVPLCAAYYRGGRFSAFYSVEIGRKIAILLILVRGSPQVSRCLTEPLVS